MEIEIAVEDRATIGRRRHERHGGPSKIDPANLQSIGALAAASP
jgi:hypothetical protein